MRLELQAEQGDTEIFYDGRTAELYDAATNTLYRYTPPAHAAATAASSPGESGAATVGGGKPGARARRGRREPHQRGERADPRLPGHHEAPSVAKIEEAIAHLSEHASVSGATPSDVAGRAAYTVRVAPKEGGSLLGGAELSFDAETGIPLRSAIYATDDSSPGDRTGREPHLLRPGRRARCSRSRRRRMRRSSRSSRRRPTTHRQRSPDAGKTRLSAHGHGVTTIAVLESPGKGAKQAESALAGLPQVKVDGVNASELRTELGTLLSFERSGVRYLLAGSVTPEALEAFARGL